MTFPLKDEDLAAYILEGNEWAIDEIIRRYQQKAYSIAYSMCAWDSEEAKDIVQDAFLKAIRNIKKFQGKSSFYTWFYRILINTCLDARRRKTRWEKIFMPWRSLKKNKDISEMQIEQMPDTNAQTNPLKVVSGREFTLELQKALNALSEKQRTVFQLKVLHGMTVPEIAVIMNSAEGTIKTHFFRAIQILRKILKDWDEKEYV